jgi:hypothetical protein
MRCRTITTATIIGGADRRPISVEHIGEHLVREQGETLPVQDRVDRIRGDPARAVVHGRAKQVGLAGCASQSHAGHPAGRSPRQNNRHAHILHELKHQPPRTSRPGPLTRRIVPSARSHPDRRPPSTRRQCCSITRLDDCNLSTIPARSWSNRYPSVYACRGGPRARQRRCLQGQAGTIFGLTETEQAALDPEVRS